MSQIFTSLAESLEDYMGADIQWLQQELTTGINMERAQVIKQDLEQSEVQASAPGVEGLGYCSSEVPMEAYIAWAIEHPGIWQNDRDWLLRKNPQWKRRYQPKAQMGWVPSSHSQSSNSSLLILP